MREVHGLKYRLRISVTEVCKAPSDGTRLVLGSISLPTTFQQRGDHPQCPVTELLT
jgi:hypothetical protein